MEIRKIQGILISSLLVAGLAGCSNSSSWSQGDDSPWKSKRDAEAVNASTEEFVELSLDEAVEVNSMDSAVVEEVSMDMAAEPELEFIDEPVPVESMSAFERLEMMADEPAPEPISEPEVVEVEVVNDIASDISSAASSDFAVQVYAGRVLANVTRYQESHGLDNMQIVKTDHDGDIIHVLVSTHNSYGAAMQASQDVEQSTGSTPWVRPVSGLQDMTVE